MGVGEEVLLADADGVCHEVTCGSICAEQLHTLQQEVSN